MLQNPFVTIKCSGKTRYRKLPLISLGLYACLKGVFGGFN